MSKTVICHEKGKDPLFKIWHTSKESMIILMHSDGGSIVFREKAYPIRSGVLCFVGGEKLHYTMPDDPDIYDRSKFFFPPETIKKLQELLPRDETLAKFKEDTFAYTQIKEDETATVEAIFQEAEKNQNTPYEDRTLLASLLRLLTIFDQNASKTAIPITGVLERAVEYISNHLSEPIRIDDVCNAVHISKYHFCRKFKKNMGMTLMDYILQTRIITAKSLLEKSEFSITEISEQCGFSSIAYFSRVFREDVGMAPSTYRKQSKI